MGKSDKQRMGQRMLGSVANHAWGEDSLYLSRSGRDKVRMEFESKVAPATTFAITNLENNRWEPVVTPWKGREDDAKPEEYSTRRSSSNGSRPPKQTDTSSVAGTTLERLGGIQTTKAVAEKSGLNYQQAYRQLSRHPRVTKTENGWSFT